jgi:hypothetical protein
MECRQPCGIGGWHGRFRKVTTHSYVYEQHVDPYCDCVIHGPIDHTTVTDPAGGKTVHNFDSNGREASTVMQTSTGTTLKTIGRTYETAALGGRLVSETTTQGSFTFSNTFTYDDHNNVLSQTAAEQGVNVRRVDRTFETSTAFTDAHIWDRRLSETLIQYPSQDQAARNEWQYDTLSLIPRSGTIPGWVDPVSAPRANVTAVRKWLNTTGSYLVTTQQYDVLGNAVTVTDPGGHATQNDFTDRFTDSISRNSFAYSTKVTDASGFYAQSTYDFNTGLVKQTTDSLSRTTTTTYDLMDRPTQVNYPDGGQTNDSYDDTIPTTTETKKVDALGNVGRVIYIYDKLYRVTRKQTADPAGDIFVDTQYDDKGRLTACRIVENSLARPPYSELSA